MEIAIEQKGQLLNTLMGLKSGGKTEYFTD